MGISIGEAHQLFRMEREAEEIDLASVPDTLRIKASDFLPGIPESWLASGEITGAEVAFEGPYFSGEILSQYQLFQIVQETLEDFFLFSRQELAVRMAQIQSKIHKSAKPQPDVYKRLEKHSHGFVTRQHAKKGSTAREIDVVIRIHLKEVSTDDLLLEGKGLLEEGETQEKLYKKAEDSLEFLRNVIEADVERIEKHKTRSEKLLEGFKKVYQSLRNSPAGNVHLLEDRSEAFKEFELLVIDSTKKIEKEDRKIQKYIDYWRKKHIPDAKRIEEIAQHTLSKLLGSGLLKPLNSKFMKWAKLISFSPQAIGLIGGLFMLRFDAGARRHKLLMKGIKQLAKGQTILEKKLNILYKQGQETDRKLVKIAENQRIIDGKVTILLANIEIFYQETQRALAHLTHEVFLANTALRAILNRGGKHASQARESLVAFPGYSSYLNRFFTYDALQKFHQKERFHLRKGLEELPSLFMQPGTNDAAFVLGATQEYDAEEYFTHYSSVLQFFLNATNTWPSQQQFAYMVVDLHSLSTITRHQQMHAKPDLGTLPEWLQHFSIEISSLVKQPYDIPLLIDNVESAWRFHYFFSLIKGVPGGPLLSLEQLKEETHREEGRKLLQDAFIRLNIAIFQANLLSGNGLLPLLFAAIEKKAPEGELKINKINEMIAPNRLLAQNFLVYVIHHILQEDGALYKYELAYNAKGNPILLNQLLGDYWDFEWNGIEKRWGVRLSEIRAPIPLPEPQRVMSGDLKPHPEIANLQYHRDQVLHELAGYFADPTNANFRTGLQLTAQTFRKIITIPMGGSHVDKIRSKL